MATLYIAYHKYPLKTIGSTTMQMEGSFIASEKVDLAAGGVSKNAPDGAQYATLWADVPFWYQIGSGLTAAAPAGSTSQPVPAGAMVQTEDVVGLGTFIAASAI